MPVRIAVMADTHDRLPAKVVETIASADQIWHLGDVCLPETLAPLRARTMPPLTIVRGNCDTCADWPLTHAIDLGGRRFLLVHIPPPRPPSGYDIVLHGHTHVPRYERVGPVLFLNPGCVTRPNRGAPASIAWLEVHEEGPPHWRIEPLSSIL
jgi:putative phosphoesterase